MQLRKVQRVDGEWMGLGLKPNGFKPREQQLGCGFLVDLLDNRDLPGSAARKIGTPTRPVASEVGPIITPSRSE